MGSYNPTLYKPQLEISTLKPNPKVPTALEVNFLERPSCLLSLDLRLFANGGALNGVFGFRVV